MGSRKSTSASLLILLITVAGFWTLTWSTFHLNFDHWRLILALFAMAMVSQWMMAVLPRGELTASFAMTLAAWQILGMAAAVWVTGLAVLFAQGIANHGQPLRRTMFNAGRHVLAVWGAAALVPLAGPKPGQALGAFIIAHFFLDTFLRLTDQVLPPRQRSPLSLVDLLLWNLGNYFLATPFGLLMAYLYPHTGMGGVLIFFFALLGFQALLRLYLRQAMHNRELAVFLQVAQSLTADLRLETTCQIFLDLVWKVVPLCTEILYLWSPEERCFQPVGGRGERAAKLRHLPVWPGEGILGSHALATEPRLVADTRKEDPVNTGTHAFEQLFRSLFVLPLTIEGETFALLVVGDKQPDAFTKRQTKLLTALGRQATLAMARALKK